MIYLSQREHYSVKQTPEGTIIKESNTPEGHRGLQNAWRFYTALDWTGVAPSPVSFVDNRMEVEYIKADSIPSAGDPQISYQERLRQNAIETLLVLQQMRVYHTDLTHYNYILRNARPVLIDWESGRFAWEDTPNKRKGPDSTWLYPSLLNVIPDTNRIIRRWLGIRNHIEAYRGFGTVLDLGTLYGDFVALAQSEGFKATGVDCGAFDTDGLVIARTRWGQFGCQFREGDITQLPNYKANIVLMLSVFDHIVQAQGIRVAERVLEQAIADSDIMFFEAHHKGDGPGSVFENDDQILHYLQARAQYVAKVVTIPVAGRDFSRTVWRIE